MRKEIVKIYESDLMQSIGGTLFRMAPNKQPRKAEIIMAKVRDKFREDAYNDNEFYILAIEKDKFKLYIRELLYSIPEFNELNLSQYEFDNNVKVDDEKRPKFRFVTAYDKETSESWRTDFIDLDAFVNFVYMTLGLLIENDRECFFCAHSSQKNSSKCSDCKFNDSLKDNYESSRAPKGKYTFSCKYDCYRGRYICCEECNIKDTCEKRCESNSDICGLTLYKKISIANITYYKTMK